MLACVCTTGVQDVSRFSSVTASSEMTDWGLCRLLPAHHSCVPPRRECFCVVRRSAAGHPLDVGHCPPAAAMGDSISGYATRTMREWAGTGVAQGTSRTCRDAVQLGEHSSSVAMRLNSARPLLACLHAVVRIPAGETITAALHPVGVGA
jgi:hypothetical protein